MASTASDSPPSNTPISSHHRTGGPSWIIGCRRIYGKPSVTNGAVRSTPIGGRGPDRIESSSRIQLGTQAAQSARMLWPID